jgi:myosin heavy subunit
MSKKPVSGLRMALIVSLLSTPLMAADQPAAEQPAAQAPAAPATPPLADDAVNAQREIDNRARESQATVDTLVERAQQAGGQYAQTMAEVDSLNKYNEQLQEQINSQLAEIASLDKQLTEIETTNREILPLMERMVATLEQFVAADVPFWKDEREKRVADLKAMMPRADIAISEKYRRILEAYQIELDYGRALEAYEGQLDDGRTVQFVKLGRISLMYQTLDRSETGYWNAQEKRWVVDASYTEGVREALSMARDEGAPELLRVPVPAPQEAR